MDPSSRAAFAARAASLGVAAAAAAHGSVPARPVQHHSAHPPTGPPPARQSPRLAYGEMRIWVGTWNLGAEDPFAGLVAGNKSAEVRLFANTINTDLAGALQALSMLM